MKLRLLPWLCCPACEGALRAEAWAGTVEEIEDGLLTCEGCARSFPIIGGIPRLLPDALADQTARYHAAFFARYRDRLGHVLQRGSQRAGDAATGAKRRTLVSYSYQWRRFRRMLPQWEQVFRECVDPIPPSFFPGRVGLDAGCGFGRSLYYAATYGAEMIGLDLSEAVEAARANTRHLPNAHVVQGDIVHPPVRRQSLDFVYSIGVLHHLSDPEAGFRALTTRLKPGAPIFIWVYSRGRGRQIRWFTRMRRISTRLPVRCLEPLALGGASLQWLCWIVPARILNRFRLTQGLARRLPFTWHGRFPFYVLYTDWFDGLSVPLVAYYRREEIAAWYQRAGLERAALPEAWGTEGFGRAIGYAPAERATAGVAGER